MRTSYQTKSYSKKSEEKEKADTHIEIGRKKKTDDEFSFSSVKSF